MLRFSSYRIHQSLVKKPLKIHDYWPIATDEQNETKRVVVDADFLEKINKVHGTNFKIKQNG